MIVGLVLLAAGLHATWNAFTQRSSDPLLTMWMVNLSASASAALLLPLTDFPAPEARPWLAASLGLHLAYQVFLVAAYRVGDLSQVYPLARGLGPVVLALWATSTGVETLAPLQVAGLALAAVGLGSLALVRSRRPIAGRAVGAALLTGLVIGSYTFVDAQGARRGARPLDFIVWLIVLDALPLSAWVWLRRRGRIGPFLKREWRRGVGGGFMAALAYGIVLWAMTRGPMAPIAALRETSVILAAWIGTRLFGEPFGGLRLLAAAAVAGGVALLQVGAR